MDDTTKRRALREGKEQLGGLKRPPTSRRPPPPKPQGRALRRHSVRGPYRSGAYLHFVHTHLQPAPCCCCGAAPWTQLHHFGGDGGMSSKPSDLWVARLCRACAIDHEVKLRALQRAGRWDLLAAFAVDALRCLEAWVVHHERGCPPAEGCTAEALTAWLASPAAEGPLEARRAWLLRWADQRAAATIDALLEEEDDPW